MTYDGSTVVMPRLSDSMEEGTIVRWLRSAGDVVRSGEPLVELETDKATVTYEAEADGVLEIIVDTGATVPIGTPIASIGESLRRESRRQASPLARRLAREAGVDLRLVTATGPRGRVVRADVERSLASTTARGPDGGRVAVSTTDGKGAPTVLELSRLQTTVARRMAESTATVPQFGLEVDVDMQGCAALRSQLKGLEGGVPLPTYNDFVVRASALALREHPRVNGAYQDGRFELYPDINVGVAVAAQDALLVPVLRAADRASLFEIALKTRQLVAAVRDGSIVPADLSGATFTISNLGAMGIDRFSAVLDPPQAAILSVGAISDRAWVCDGEVEVRSIMTIRMTCDHRILYGADGAAFLTSVRTRLQSPLSLLV
jgi:pyruvate dehydrogenase E2 component (dihydrolipoamide acetyltransferase)